MSEIAFNSAGLAEMGWLAWIRPWWGKRETGNTIQEERGEDRRENERADKEEQRKAREPFERGFVTLFTERRGGAAGLQGLQPCPWQEGGRSHITTMCITTMCTTTYKIDKIEEQNILDF